MEGEITVASPDTCISTSSCDDKKEERLNLVGDVKDRIAFILVCKIHIFDLLNLLLTCLG
jgi:uncharacterized DUF497 family protein